MKWLSHLLDQGMHFDMLRMARSAVSMTIAAACAFSAPPLGKSVAVRTFMSNAALHRPVAEPREHFDTAQVLSFVWFWLYLGDGDAALAPLDVGVRRAFSEVLWAIDGHARSSDTHCLFRERLLDLDRHRDDPAGSYFTRASLFWPKEVRPGSSRGNSSGKSGHWSRTFKIWSTTPARLCTLHNLRELFRLCSSGAHVKVAVAGSEFTPAWHQTTKTAGVFRVVTAGTVASDVATVMVAAGLRDGETAHQIRGASASKAHQLSNGKLKDMVLETARWSGDTQFQTSYEGFVRCWDMGVPPAAMLRNDQQVQRWGVIPPRKWVGKELFASEVAHVDGEPFSPLVQAVVTSVDYERARRLVSRPFPRARLHKDRRRLLRGLLPVFTIRATGELSWIRTDVPFAVVADGRRRWVHFQSDADVALTEHRWC